MKDWMYDANKLYSVPLEGYEIWIPSSWTGMGREFRKGIYEPGMVQCLRDVLRPEMIFFDVGAEIGFYTMLATSRVKQVYAFEPIWKSRQILLENIGRNGLDNVTVVTEPLFSKQVSGTMGSKRRFRLGEGDIQTMTLDQFGVVPDVIKLDVEGAEADVFLGGGAMLTQHKPIVMLELHPRLLSRFHRAPKDPKRILRRYGYRTWTCLGEKKDSDISWWKIEK